MPYSPDLLAAEVLRLGHFFDLQVHLTVKPLRLSELREVEKFVLRPHFLLQGSLAHSSWRDWLPYEASAAETSLLFILHFGWGRLTCSVRRVNGLRTMALSRATLSRTIARSKAGRYISSVVLPYLALQGYPGIRLEGISEVAGPMGGVEAYCDKFDERLTLRELHAEDANLDALLSVLLGNVEEPELGQVVLKSEVDAVVRWLDDKRCKESADLGPLLSYESELAAGPDLALQSVPAVLGMAVTQWQDRSVVLDGLLYRYGHTRMAAALGLLQITTSTGGLDGRLVLFERPSDAEMDVLRQLPVPIALGGRVI
jgi:hypothetical protein